MFQMPSKMYFIKVFILVTYVLYICECDNKDYNNNIKISCNIRQSEQIGSCDKLINSTKIDSNPSKKTCKTAKSYQQCMRKVVKKKKFNSDDNGCREYMKLVIDEYKEKYERYCKRKDEDDNDDDDQNQDDNNNDDKNKDKDKDDEDQNKDSKGDANQSKNVCLSLIFCLLLLQNVLLI